jgi:hypothetical protein
MLIGIGYVIGFIVIGFIAVIAIARALKARSSLHENRKMRDYLRRTMYDRNAEF